MIKNDFINLWGEEKWFELMVPKHQDMAPLLPGQTKRMGETEEEKAIFRLMEMCDFDCFQFDCNQDLAEADVKKFLVDHVEEVKMMTIDPPSFIGLIAGAFDFMFKREVEK